LSRPLDGGNGQLEWLLRALDRRFQIRAVGRGPSGLTVAQLAARRG
jgi:hypothetical protein